MRSTFFLASLVAVSSYVYAAKDGPIKAVDTSYPLGFMLELDPGASIAAIDAADLRKRAVWTDHDAIYHHLEKRKIGFRLRHEFKDHPELFYGASVKLSQSADRAQLSHLPGVKAVWPIEQVYFPMPAHSNSTSTPPDLSTKRKMAKRAVLPQKQGKLNGYGPLAMTGLDLAQSYGFKGKGVNIAIVDTGFDYTHPDLGGCFGPGCRVAKGYDFVGDSFSATGVAVPDGDPFSNCYDGAHGTHVAGIAAGAYNVDMGIGGAAPEATIFAYKINDCTTASTTDLLMQAIIRAVDDGADIINLSLAQTGGWTLRPLSVFLTRVIETAKIFVVVAAGDNGAAGLWFPAVPANAPAALSVGMVNSVASNQFSITTSTGYGPILYYGSHSFSFASLPIYATSSTIGADADACDPLPDSTPNLANRIVVVSRGGCFVFTKLENIAAKGGQRVLIYDYDGETAPIYEDGTSVGFPNGNSGFISYADGAYLANQFYSSAAGFTVSGTDKRIWQGAAPGGGKINIDSQLGPTFDLFPGVDITAPGANILSTFPLALGGYSILTGSSMAAPYVAGALATYISANKLTKPYDVSSISNAFVWAAKPTNASYSGVGGLDHVITQGGGLLDAFVPLTTVTTNISPSIISLNDTRFFAQDQQLTLKNSGTTAKTYAITHQPTRTVYSLDPNSIYPVEWPSTNVPSAARVSVNGGGETTSITVQPGQTATITLRFSQPSRLDVARFPVFSGFLVLETNSEQRPDRPERFTVPYYGVAARMYDLPIIDTGSRIVAGGAPLITDNNGVRQTGPKTYTYVGASVPNIGLRLVGGTPHLRFHILSADYTPPTPAPGSARLAYSSIPTLGSIPNFETFYSARNPSDDTLCLIGGCTTIQYLRFNGQAQAADGTISTLPNGSYKIVITTTKITGDDTNWNDHEAWVSPVITIQR